jgi:hypothetical protein
MLQRFVDAAAVEAEIERVRSLSGAALRRRWQAEFGRPLPKSLPGDLLRRMIANRIQEQAFGTLILQRRRHAVTTQKYQALAERVARHITPWAA